MWLRHAAVVVVMGESIIGVMRSKSRLDLVGNRLLSIA